MITNRNRPWWRHRRLVVDLIATAVLVTLTTGAVAVYRYRSGTYVHRINNPEVFECALAAQRPTEATTLVLGDSVAIQLFPNHAGIGDPVSLATNGSITLAGQDLLLREFASHNRSLRHVVLILTPFCLQIDLDTQFTYHLFLKPFDTPVYRRHMSQLAQTAIDRFPASSIVAVPQIRTGNWSPPIRPIRYADNTPPLSSFNREHLERMVRFCQRHAIQFSFVAPPVSPHYPGLVDRLRLQVQSDPSISRPLQVILEDYLDTIRFAPLSQFKDTIHLVDPRQHFLDLQPYFTMPIDLDHWHAEASPRN